MPVSVIFSLGRYHWKVVTYWVIYEPMWIVRERGLRVKGRKWEGIVKFRIAQAKL